MLKFGIISEVKKGYARVTFDENGIVSALLPILQRRTKDDKSFETFDLNEHVVCLMDERNEYGTIIGAIYSKKDLEPTGAGNDTFIREFSDGTVIKYNRADPTHQYEITNGDLTFKMSRTGGFEISRGTDSVKKVIHDLTEAIITGCSGPGGGAIVPAAFIAIQTRLTALFSN